MRKPAQIRRSWSGAANEYQRRALSARI